VTTGGAGWGFSPETTRFRSVQEVLLGLRVRRSYIFDEPGTLSLRRDEGGGPDMLPTDLNQSGRGQLVTPGWAGHVSDAISV
jgi:hypothetical protein